jgi:hypothetical protein
MNPKDSAADQGGSAEKKEGTGRAWTKEWAEKNVIPDLMALGGGVSGRMGGLIFVTDRDGKISVREPRPKPTGPLTDRQKAQRQRFRDATAYARGALADEEKRRIYEAAGRRRQRSAYCIAFQDFLRPPEIYEIQTGWYSGRKGDRIYIYVGDVAPVCSVSVTLRNGRGRLIESECVPQKGNSSGAVFVAQKNLRRSQIVRVQAVATDLAGSTTAASAECKIDSPPTGKPGRRARKVWFPEI